MTPTTSARNRVRDLNNAFRTGGGVAGQWFFARGVADRGSAFVALATAAVKTFDSFTPDNDPYGEHDFGAINLAGETLFWKIDAHDATMTNGSADPSDPALTRRALTIMLASEY
jgi:hypothetical protein